MQNWTSPFRSSGKLPILFFMSALWLLISQPCHSFCRGQLYVCLVHKTAIKSYCLVHTTAIKMQYSMISYTIRDLSDNHHRFRSDLISSYQLNLGRFVAPDTLCIAKQWRKQSWGRICSWYSEQWGRTGHFGEIFFYFCEDFLQTKC